MESIVRLLSTLCVLAPESENTASIEFISHCPEGASFSLSLWEIILKVNAHERKGSKESLFTFLASSCLPLT